MEGYPMKVLGAYNGTAGDSFMYHAGSKFSTKDMDQDSWPEGSCAQAHGNYIFPYLILVTNTISLNNDS